MSLNLLKRKLYATQLYGQIKRDGRYACGESRKIEWQDTYYMFPPHNIGRCVGYYFGTTVDHAHVQEVFNQRRVARYYYFLHGVAPM
jgi:hypothetical protein